MATYVYTPLDDPLALSGVFGTWASGINAAGQIVGSYADILGVIHGFTYSAGIYTTISGPLPSSSITEASGINSAGQIIGSYANFSYGQYRHPGAVAIP